MTVEERGSGQLAILAHTLFERLRVWFQLRGCRTVCGRVLEEGIAAVSLT